MKLENVIVALDLSDACAELVEQAKKVSEQKPWDEDDLRFIINSAFELFDLRSRNGELTDKLKKVNKQLEILLRQNLIS